MNIIKVPQIEEYLLHITPQFGLPDFKDILRIHVSESYFKVMSTLLRQSLLTYEKKVPLFHTALISVPGETYQFVDNTEEYFLGIVGERYWTPIPEGIINLSGSLINEVRVYHYDKPYLRNLTGKGIREVYYTTRRPVRFFKDLVKDEFDINSFIYEFDLWNDYKTEQFLKEVILTIIRYMLELKRQVNYTDLPIQIYDGLDEKYNQIDAELNEFYLSPTIYANLWR